MIKVAALCRFPFALALAFRILINNIYSNKRKVTIEQQRDVARESPTLSHLVTCLTIITVWSSGTIRKAFYSLHSYLSNCPSRFGFSLSL